MPDEQDVVDKGAVECALCHRAVRADEVNSSGRCAYCAGQSEPLGGQASVDEKEKGDDGEEA